MIYAFVCEYMIKWYNTIPVIIFLIKSAEDCILNAFSGINITFLIFLQKKKKNRLCLQSTKSNLLSVKTKTYEI